MRGFTNFSVPSVFSVLKDFNEFGWSGKFKSI
jgi:hypothetical protein